MKRKIVAFTLVAVMAIALSATALAAPADDLRAELDRLASKYSGSQTVQEYVSEAKKWLDDSANAATITDAMVTTIKAEVAKAEATAGSAATLAELSDAQIASIVANISNAAAAAGFPNFTIDVSGESPTLRLGNASPSSSSDNPIRQTGLEANMTGIIVVGVIVVILAAIAVFAYLPKKRTDVSDAA